MSIVSGKPSIYGGWQFQVPLVNIPKMNRIVFMGMFTYRILMVIGINPWPFVYVYIYREWYSFWLSVRWMVLFWVLLRGLDLMDGDVLCSSILGAPRTLLCKLVESNKIYKFYFVKCWKANSAVWKYVQKGFVWMITLKDPIHRLKSSNNHVHHNKQESTTQ